MESLEIQLTAPFDASLSMHVWKRSPLEQIDVVEDGIYSRLFLRPQGPVLLRWQPKGTIDKPSIELSWEGDFNQADDLSWAMELTRWIFNDAVPLKQFYAHVEKSDPTLFELTQRLNGLRPLMMVSVFETLVFAILGQQVNLNFTYMCKHALENTFCRGADIDGKKYLIGLRPEDLSNATVEDLRAMKISNNKARAILELAEAFRIFPIDRTTLDGLSDDEIIESLTALRGIGPWTAEYTLLRALGSLDVLPAGDAGLQNAIRSAYSLATKPSPDEVRKRAEAWKPYRALTTYYLWTSLAY